MSAASQLTLIELEPATPHGSMPLKEALELLAEVWSLRHGRHITVTGDSWAGWTLGESDDNR